MTRKAIFIFSLLCLMSGAAVAQRFQARVIAGLNAAQIQGDGLAGYNKPGLIAGVGAAFPLGGGWSLEPEAIYSQKGSRTSDREFELMGNRYIFRLNYMELPIMINYGQLDFLRFQFGLAPAVLINAQVDDGLTSFRDYTDRFNRLDWMAAAGLEWRAFDNLGLNVRISHSVLPINKTENRSGATNTSTVAQAFYGAGMFNNVLSFTLRYNFDMSGK